jgi:hypothetical protein
MFGRTSSLLVATVLASLVTACGGTYTVSRMTSQAPDQILTAAISPQDGNSSEVTAAITSTLLDQGVAVNPPLPARTVKSSEVDAIVTYMDVWRWDLATYMQSIAIKLYSANTGELLVSGRWHDSFLHAYNRGETVAQRLIAEMIAAVQANPDPGKKLNKD